MADEKTPVKDSDAKADNKDESKKRPAAERAKKSKMSKLYPTQDVFSPNEGENE